MHQDWKIEIDGKVFELDRNSEEHQAVYKFLNAESYKEKLQIWIDYFAFAIEQGEFFNDIFIARIENKDYFFSISMLPDSEDQTEVLKGFIIKYSSIDYSVVLNLLGIFRIWNVDHIKFFNKWFVLCVKTMMTIKDEEIMNSTVHNNHVYIKTYNEIKDDLEARSKIAPVDKIEFYKNELSRIKDTVFKISRNEQMWKKNQKEKYWWTMVIGEHLYPPGCHPDDYEFQNLVEQELKNIKVGIPFIPVDKEINWVKNSKWRNIFFGPRQFWRILLAYQYAQIIFDLEQWITDPPEKEALPGKSEGLKTFRWIKDPEKELPILYEKMRGELISPETTLEQFTAIFTSRPIEEVEPVEWIEKTVLLAYFIEEYIIKKAQGYNEHWKIAAKCFFHKTNKITQRNLLGSKNNYLDNKSGNPRDSCLVDGLF